MIDITTKASNQQRTDRLCYLFLIFLTGCIVGWIYEEIFYWITEGLLRNRGLLYGPWLPIYGIGALGIFAMKPLKKHPALLFLLCALVAGIVEYIIGFAGIHFFGVRLWDYRELFLNISGIICLRSGVSFAVMGILFLYLLEPIMGSVIVRLNPKTVRTSCLVLLLVLIADCILSALFRTPITY
ncbi:MAG: putative ABC transporter permease [Anaerovoracaceae bacterium]